MQNPKKKVVTGAEFRDVKILAKKKITKYILMLREDGILHCHLYKNVKWTPDDFKLLIPAMGKMVNYQKVPLLITYGENIYPSVNASAEWANPNTTCNYFSCEAHVLDSVGLKLLGNFYLEHKKPLRTTRIFENQKEAIEWLKTFL